MRINQLLKSSLLKNAGIYTITNFINALIPFFLLPILTRHMTPKEYGIVSMFTVLISFVTPFIGVSINSAIARAYYDNEKIDFKKYVANSLYILLVSSFVVSIIFFIFSDKISSISLFPQKFLGIVIVYSFAQFIVRVILTLWQVQVKPIKYGIFQISQTAFNTLLSVMLVVSLNMSWYGRVFGQTISYIIFAVIAFVILYRNGFVFNKYSKEYITHALGFGIPLIPHAIGGVLMTMTDRIFITNMVGVDATGIYSVGYQIGVIISLLSESFNKAYVPWLFEQLKRNFSKKKVQIVWLTYAYFIIILLIAIVLGLVSPWFLNKFVGKEFSSSSIYVIWIALGYAFKGMYLMVTNYIFYATKTSILAWVTFVAAVLNVILNYIFIKEFGAIGAAQATSIIYLIKFIATWVLSAKVYSMPWNIFKTRDSIEKL
ncbi:MAG: oligosaccharide flippase family protein [Epulopiscium sp.]|nr:oligosaccharide flippase family protein [Candidatus Epulonipiscium sp.]